MAMQPPDLRSLCDLLVERGMLDDAQVRSVLVKENGQRQRLLREQAAVRSGRHRAEILPWELLASFRLPLKGEPNAVLDEDRLARLLAELSAIPYEKIDPLKLDMKLITQVLSRPFARRHSVLVLRQEGPDVVVAVADPFDVELVENLRRLIGRSVRPVVSSKLDIQRIITEVYGFRSSVNAAAEGMELGTDLGNLEQLVKLKAVDDLEATDKHVVAAVEYMLHYAFDQRASDIHIEPKRDHSLVRMRIDGVLHNITTLPRVVHNAAVSRLKMLARMDISEKRRPQDGRIKTGSGEAETELRLSTMPVAFGEKVVLRIFDPTVLLQDLSALGFNPRDFKLYEEFIVRPNGLVLVTGPTGSGKTTTLYSSLKYLASPEINIVSIEDPIEMVVEDFNQVAVKPNIDITFGSALRTILRQDPDVIMVGEVRDAETASNAVQAALTGHMVFATLHTNDSGSAIGRILDLGVEPFLLSSTLVGIVAQRLLRLICVQCKRKTYLTPDQINLLHMKMPEDQNRRLPIYHGEGCPACRGTGYVGRTAVYEVMPVSDKICKLINQRSDTKEIMKVARLDGMMTLRETAIKKLAQGLTTFEEIMRVTVE
ncbi:MAG TPA: ATPase, T2SS/T4P/T4SS family [Myxococcota bacterium]|nr:ATPase, T2SS/T4P/T4SS family [Myxococcota bacterium]HRY94204.1 ATPase, T2SS/T4P/T4SS family [Myxococcota bacterium]